MNHELPVEAGQLVGPTLKPLGVVDSYPSFRLYQNGTITLFEDMPSIENFQKFLHENL